MFQRTLAAFGLAIVTATAIAAQTVADDKILAAIKAGESKKYDHLISECYAKAGFGEGMAAALAGGVSRDGGFRVTLSTNEGRIAFMAERAKRLYKKFTIEDVTDDLKNQAVILTIEPSDPSRVSGNISVAAPIEHVVLKSKSKGDVIAQPTRIEKEPVEWSNLMGGKVEANRAVAFFDVAAVKELPPGEFDIVVISTAGERKCKVGLKDRQKLFAMK